MTTRQRLEAEGIQTAVNTCPSAAGQKQPQEHKDKKENKQEEDKEEREDIRKVEEKEAHQKRHREEQRRRRCSLSGFLPLTFPRRRP